MLSIIKRYEFVSELLKSYPEIIEVYSCLDFNMELDIVTLYILKKGDFDIAALYRRLYTVYDDVHLYVTENQLDPMFIGQKIVWRKGVWFSDVLYQMR